MRYLKFLRIKLENGILFHYSIKKVIRSTLLGTFRKKNFFSIVLSTFSLVYFVSLKKALVKKGKMFSI